jgi:hypothetical protein
MWKTFFLKILSPCGRRSPHDVPMLMGTQKFRVRWEPWLLLLFSFTRKLALVPRAVVGLRPDEQQLIRLTGAEMDSVDPP